jgi:uroporphyrinogen-III synthase
VRGKKIAVLESRLGAQMLDLIARRGGLPVHAPALAEIPEIDPGFIATLVDELERRPAKLAIFQTGVGVQALFAATDGLGLTERLRAALAKATVAVRGPKPTGPLRARQVRIDLSAAEPFTTTEILAAIGDIPLQGERVVVQRYGGRNVDLDQALAGKGAAVLEIPTYRWAMPADTGPLVAMMDALDRGEIHAVVFTSAAQVDNLFTVAAQVGRADALRVGLGRALVASIGPVCSAALRKAGLTVGLEASPPKLGPLIAALDAALTA